MVKGTHKGSGKKRTKRTKRNKRTKRKMRGGFAIPKIIWAYWDSVEIPADVQPFFDRRKRILTGWEHRILNKETVNEYIDKASFPEGLEKLKIQHQVDWIRLALLEKHGGCWMDARIIVNKADELESIYKEAMDVKPEMVGFYTEKFTKDKKPESYIENFFIMAPAKSKTIELWKKELELSIQMTQPEYKKHIFKTLNVDNIYKPDNDDTYLTMHACLQSVLNTHKPKLILKRAEDTLFYLHEDSQWNGLFITQRLENNDPIARGIPFIKLTNGEHGKFERYFNDTS